MRLAFATAAFGLALATGLPGQGFAEELSIESDLTVMMILPATPGAVIVGNPTIADATVQNDKLLIHGRSFGTTNLVVLDMDGKKILDYEISVKHEVDNHLALFKGQSGANGIASRFSYICAPLCQSELQIGDNSPYNAMLTEQTKNKVKLATGQEDSKSEAPPAPQ